MRSHHVSHVAVFTRRVADFMDPPPPTLSAADTCGAAVKLLRDPAASSVVVLDASRRPAGIITEQDIVHRVAFQCDALAPLEPVLTRPVISISERDYLFQAIALMRRHNMRHLPAVDDAGRLCGVLHLHKALSHSVPLLLGMIDALTPDDLQRNIGEMKAAQVRIAVGLLDDQLPAPEIQVLLTHFNNDIYRRVAKQALAGMRDDGWGEPPVGFDIIVMGSGGRGESYLFPDQDNGFVLDDYADAEHTRVDAWFVELAGRLTQALDEIGITLCKGFVMASNPLWRKSLSQWRAQLDGWLRHPNDAALRLTDIFFDFVAVFGAGDNAGALRDYVTDTLPRRPAFLQRMQRVQRGHGVALGLFRRLSVDSQPGPHQGKLNLKYHGLLPLVEAVRLLALRAGIPATSTLERIAHLTARGVLSRDEQDHLGGAFRHITALVLRQQLEDFQAGGAVAAYVPPEALSEREKDTLIRALQAIDDLRGRVDGEFSGAVF